MHEAEVFASIGAETILTPVRSPKANAFAERWVRTVREDCLDHVIAPSRYETSNARSANTSSTTTEVDLTVELSSLPRSVGGRSDRWQHGRAARSARRPHSRVRSRRLTSRSRDLRLPLGSELGVVPAWNCAAGVLREEGRCHGGGDPDPPRMFVTPPRVSIWTLQGPPHLKPASLWPVPRDVNTGCRLVSFRSPTWTD